MNFNRKYAAGEIIFFVSVNDCVACEEYLRPKFIYL